MPSPIGAPHAHVHVAKTAGEKPLNPAQQARAAEPGLTGRAFGQLVSSIAKAKHEPAPAVVAPTPPPPVVTPPTESVVAPPADGTGTTLDVQA